MKRGCSKLVSHITTHWGIAASGDGTRRRHAPWRLDAGVHSPDARRGVGEGHANRAAAALSVRAGSGVGWGRLAEGGCSGSPGG